MTLNTHPRSGCVSSRRCAQTLGQTPAVSGPGKGSSNASAVGQKVGVGVRALDSSGDFHVTFFGGYTFLCTVKLATLHLPRATSAPCILVHFFNFTWYFDFGAPPLGRGRRDLEGARAPSPGPGHHCRFRGACFHFIVPRK